MNIKKIKILNIFILFILSFPLHFLYDIFPNKLISVISPVNESLWEHMKILYTSHIITSIIEYYIIKRNNIKVNNFKSNVFLTSTLSIIIYLLIYIPINIFIKENLIISITIMLITYIITQYISYKIITKKKEYYKLNKISIPLIIIIYIIFTILTYIPPKLEIFYDTLNKKYGP